MSVSAWDIYAAKVERCCRYSGVMRRIYMSVWRCRTPDVQKTTASCEWKDGQKMFEDEKDALNNPPFLSPLFHMDTHCSVNPHSYNSCFVSWVMFCSAVVSLWGVFLFCRFSLLCVGLCYSFYSRLEIHFGKTIQTKCFKSKIGFRRLFSLKTVNAAILPAAGFLSRRQTLSAASPSRSETKAPVPVSS